MSKFKTVRRVIKVICNSCWGSGLAIGGKCETCKGSGQVDKVINEIVHEETLTTPE